MLLVVGIVSTAPARTDGLISVPPTGASIAFGQFKNTAASASLRHTSPSQPRDVRREGTTEALFELEDDDEQGFHEILIPRAGERLPKSNRTPTANLTVRCVRSDRPADSGRSSLLRC